MSTNFPASLDTLTNPAPLDGLTGHAQQHSNENDAIEALQAKVGVDGSAVPTSLDYKVAELNAGKMPANATTDAVVEGAANLYFTAQRVRDAVLTGLSTATNAVITATDTVLGALGKLQKQISDILTALNLKAPIASPSFTGTLTHSGDVVLSGSGKRITGDFSNATVNNRLMLQSSTVDGATNVEILPNGTSRITSIIVSNTSSASNTSFANLLITATDVRLQSAARGTGNLLPIVFYTSHLERMRIDTSGNVLVTSPAGLGYGPGAGGTVTQSTSKSTPVTLNKPCGRITTHNAALAPGEQVTFHLSNSLIGLSDIVKVTTCDLGNAAPDAYEVRARTAAGIAVITIRNSGGATYSENIGILFQISKGATS